MEFKQLAAVVLNIKKRMGFLLKDLVPLVQNVGMTHRGGFGPWSTYTLLMWTFMAQKAVWPTLGLVMAWAGCQWKMLVEAKDLLHHGDF